MRGKGLFVREGCVGTWVSVTCKTNCPQDSTFNTTLTLTLRNPDPDPNPDPEEPLLPDPIGAT